MNNILEITKKYDKVLEEQKKTLAKMNRLISLAELLLQDINKVNGGIPNAN
jgi:hypothetical protein